MYLMIAVVGVRVFALGRAAFRYAERIALHDSAFRMLANLRPRIFAKLIPFSPAGLAGASKGDILSKITADVDELQNLPLRVISPLAQSVFVALISVVGLALLLPSAAIALLVALILSFFVALPISALASRKADTSSAATKSKLSEQTIELLENQKLWQSLGWLPAKTAELLATDSKLRRIQGANSKAVGIGQSIFSILATAATVATSFFGAQSVADGKNPAVLLASFALLPLAVFDVISASQATLSAWQKFKNSADRLNELLERQVPAELREVSGTTLVGKIKSVELRNLYVGYPGAESTLHNFNLKVQAGETLAVYGPSGAGKTTAALVLANLLGVRRGEYLINDSPANTFDIESLRERIGYLEQTPTIFMGTVRANLLVAKPNAEDVELELVLHSVGLSETFKLREGLDTQLGDRGVLISGGEAQRLALARALLKGFDLLILDEPTANVDQAQGLELVRDLLQIAKKDEGRSIVLITHDVNLGSLADRSIEISQ